MAKREKVKFNNHSGQVLSAVIQFPEVTTTKAFAVFSHCFTCNKNLNAVRYISNSLSKAGIAVLSFDFTGLGESEGDFMDTNFSTNVEDIQAAADFLSEYYEPPQLLVGHSLGGSAALFASVDIDSVKAVATIGSPAQPNHVKRVLADAMEDIEKGEAEVTIAGRVFTFKGQFVNDLERHYVDQVMKKFRKALLILHSPTDDVVGIENAAEIYNRALHPKSFMSLDGADHLLLDKEDGLYAGSVIASWAKRYMKLKSIPEPDSERHTVALNKPEDGYTTFVNSDGHNFIVDEPESLNGENLGPSPGSLSRAALASCSAITMRMYANRKKWPVQDLKVHVDYELKIEEVNGKKIRKEIFYKEVEIEGELTEEQKKRMYAIAAKCPVHRTLEAQAEIISSLK
jgi:putative redox protein